MWIYVIFFFGNSSVLANKVLDNQINYIPTASAKTGKLSSSPCCEPFFLLNRFQGLQQNCLRKLTLPESSYPNKPENMNTFNESTATAINTIKYRQKHPSLPLNILWIKSSERYDTACFDKVSDFLFQYKNIIVLIFLPFSDYNRQLNLETPNSITKRSALTLKKTTKQLLQLCITPVFILYMQTI